MRRLRALGGLLVVLVLAGCAAIPIDGPVREGVTTAQEPADDGLSFQPSGPFAGADQAAIVQGFLAAATGQQGNYEVAREFLTEDFAPRWDPAAGVTVADGGFAIRSDAEGALEATATVIGRVDATGRLTGVDDTVVRLPFTVVEEGGEQRIASAPDGVVLAAPSFERLFTSGTLSFFTPDWSGFVPDVRWFASRLDTAQTRAAALLAGPTAALQTPVTASAFPDGTALRETGVSIDDGVATVDLTSDAAVATETEQQRMREQLLETLRGVQGIVDVRLAIDGAVQTLDPLDIPAASVPDSRPYVVTAAGEAGYLVSGRIRADPSLQAALAGIEPLGLTVVPAEGRAVVRTAAGVLSARAGEEPVLVDDRIGVIDPSLDPQGYVWTAAPGDAGGLRATGADGGQPVTGLGDAQRVVAVEVARDGTRVLLLLDTPSGPTAQVAGVQRDDDGRPVALTDDRFTIDVPGTEGISATWVTTDSVAVLGASDGAQRILHQDVGGIATSLGVESGAVRLVGGLGLTGLRALIDDGTLAVPRGGTWQTVQADAVALAVQR